MLQFNHRTVGHLIRKGKIEIIISTKEKIKNEAFTLFARKGYYGTSVSDIVKAVGINKSSLYSHYAGKDELFLAVFEDVTDQFRTLFEHLTEASKDMKTEARLCFNFEEYILYFYKNPEIFRLSNHGLLHVTQDLRDKIRADFLRWEKTYRKTLEDVFLQGMQQGIIRRGTPEKMVWSFKAKRDGVLGWLHGSPDLDEKCIRDFWHDFWFGVAGKNK